MPGQAVWLNIIAGEGLAPLPFVLLFSFMMTGIQMKKKDA